MSNHATKIGTVTLHSEMIHTKRYQTACWSMDVVCQPQTVDLYFSGQSVFAKFDGVTANANFPSGFGGLYQSNSKYDATRNDQPDSAPFEIMLQSSVFVRAMLVGTNGSIEIEGRDITMDIDLWFLQLLAYETSQAMVSNESPYYRDPWGDKARLCFTPTIAGMRVDTSHMGRGNAPVVAAVAAAAEWEAAKCVAA